MNEPQIIYMKRKGLSGTITGLNELETIHVMLTYSVPKKTWVSEVAQKHGNSWATLFKVESPGLLSVISQVDDYAKDSKLPYQKLVKLKIEGGMDTMIKCEEYWRGVLAQEQRAAQYAN